MEVEEDFHSGIPVSVSQFQSLAEVNLLCQLSCSPPPRKCHFIRVYVCFSLSREKQAGSLSDISLV